MYYPLKCAEAPHDGAYDRLFWENTEIEKPSKSQLDALDNDEVDAELTRRAEVGRKAYRDENAKTDITVLAAFDIYKSQHADATLSQYLDYLETLA